MIRKLEIEEVKNLYREHIKKDFPKNERPPSFVIKNNLKNNIQEGFIYVKDDTELGYATIYLSEESILISLFGVFEGSRGKGIGTNFIKEICDHYDTKKSIFVEVEKPELAKSEEGKKVSERRISFYKKAGFSLYKDIDYTIFGVPMYLMASSKKKLSEGQVITEMKTIREKVLKKGLRQGMKIK